MPTIREALTLIAGGASLVIEIVRVYVFRQPIAVPAWVEEARRVSEVPTEWSAAWRDVNCNTIGRV